MYRGISLNGHEAKEGDPLNKKHIKYEGDGNKTQRPEDVQRLDEMA